MFYIYGIANCRYCDLAKELLEEEGIGYSYHDVESNPALQDIFKEFGFKTVPQIFDDAFHVGGFDHLKDYLERWY